MNKEMRERGKERQRVSQRGNMKESEREREMGLKIQHQPFGGITKTHSSYLSENSNNSNSIISNIICSQLAVAI